MHVTKKRDMCYFLAGVAFLNFFVFAAIDMFLGSHLAGVDGGHYFFVAQDHHYFLVHHGTSIAVSPVVYWYSQLHLYSLFVTMPLGIWAISRARKLHREVESYSPFTARNI
jgi:hypothetical protein